MNKGNHKKLFFAAFLALLVVGCFLTSNSASAAAVINNVKVNGAGAATVNPGVPITATVNVTLTSLSVWKSTAYRFGDGNWNCVDTPDHSGNTTAEETFAITAPVEAGTKNVTFEIYGNNNCTNGLDMALAAASLSGAVMSIFSLGTGKVWLAVLIAIVVAIIIFYTTKRIIGKKTKINSEDKL